MKFCAQSLFSQSKSLLTFYYFQMKISKNCNKSMSSGNYTDYTEYFAWFIKFWIAKFFNWNFKFFKWSVLPQVTKRKRKYVVSFLKFNISISRLLWSIYWCTLCTSGRVFTKRQIKWREVRDQLKKIASTKSFILWKWAIYREQYV